MTMINVSPGCKGNALRYAMRPATCLLGEVNCLPIHLPCAPDRLGVDTLDIPIISAGVPALITVLQLDVVKAAALEALVDLL